MSEGVSASGSCLCKAVSFTSAATSRDLGACHCGMCRRWSGGPLLSLEATPVFTGEEHITLYASSDWAERGFCRHCGSHLFYRTKDRTHYYMPVGLFDAVEGITFTHQIFIDRKPDYYSFADHTGMMTEAEVMAMFAQE
ncbi:MAG: GFA family protein [Rhodospirillaceae bacterium]|nr:GFA family protein [Rhodospirillaceae bacterium]